MAVHGLRLGFSAGASPAEMPIVMTIPAAIKEILVVVMSSSGLGLLGVWEVYRKSVGNGSFFLGDGEPAKCGKEGARAFTATGRGEAIGLVRVKMFRPFPTGTLREALSGVRRVAVLDRNVSVGHGGIFAEEIRSALYDVLPDDRPQLYGVCAGSRGTGRNPRRHRRRGAGRPTGRARGSLGGSESMSHVMIADQIPRDELMTSGHLACPGCGAPMAMRMVLNEPGPKTVVVMPACC